MDTITRRARGAADETVLNIVRMKKKKIPQKIFLKRRAKLFSASLAHFDTVPTCWVCNISQWANFCYTVGRR
jgi:hypothetical protein